jgi:hypothetical protein
MEKINFKTWLRLQETGTSTGDVAIFQRPLFSQPVTRQWLGPWAEEDPFFKKKKKKSKHVTE